MLIFLFLRNMDSRAHIVPLVLFSIACVCCELDGNHDRAFPVACSCLA